MKKIISLIIVVAFFATTGAILSAPSTAAEVYQSQQRVEPEPYPYAVAPDNAFIAKDSGVVIIDAGISFTHDRLIRARYFFERHDVRHMIIIINSGGGALFEGVATAQYMLEMEAQGWLIETKCYGLAASAASIIMAAGSKGYRYISPHSFLMIHELSVFTFYASESVSDKEKEAKVLRGIQDNVSDLIAKCTGNTIQKIKKAAKDETWLLAKRAIQMGFADKLIPDGLKKRASEAVESGNMQEIR